MELKEVVVNGEKVESEKLQEIKENLPKKEKLVEVSPGNYKTLTRMQE